MAAILQLPQYVAYLKNVAYAFIKQGGQSATPDSEKIAKNRKKSGKNQEKSGKKGKIGKKRQKSGSFFHFAPPDR